MINTQLADSTVFALAVISSWFIGNYFYRQRQVAVKKTPLLLVVFAATWCLLNMVGHLVAVLWVNIIRMQQGAFTYTFHFYGLLLMGVVFFGLNVFQLNRIKSMMQGNYYLRRQLFMSCGMLALLSFPLFPLNPIGLLPVISSVLIVVTIAATKKQWRMAHLQHAELKSYATVA